MIPPTSQASPQKLRVIFSSSAHLTTSCSSGHIFPCHTWWCHPSSSQDPNLHLFNTCLFLPLLPPILIEFFPHFPFYLCSQFQPPLVGLFSAAFWHVTPSLKSSVAPPACVGVQQTFWYPQSSVGWSNNQIDRSARENNQI